MLANTTIWETIADTPWWFYVFFIYLAYMGFLATKPHRIYLSSIVVNPILFVILTAVCIYFTPQLSITYFFTWVSALCAGTLLGWLHFRMKKIKAAQHKKILYLPGSWVFLMALVMLTAVKYYFNYQFNLNIHELMQGKYSPYLIPLYGFFTGLFVGRITYSVQCIKHGPYVTE